MDAPPPQSAAYSPRRGAFQIAAGGKLSSFRRVETEQLSEARREALRSLLDDASAPVRKALLLHFTQLGPAASRFLQEEAHGANRLLARHAAWFLGELKFTDPVAEFRGFIRSLNYELETGALLLSRTVSPALDVGACCTALDRIAARCRELIVAPASAREQCRVLNRVLFHEWGFHGNVEHYTDPANSLLDRVLERRKGIPISLSIVYLLVAQRIGLELEPVGLPGHFIVGCFGDAQPFFVDAFDKGVFLDPDEIFALLRANQIAPKAADLMPTPVREVLCRTCRNLVNHYHAAGDDAHARLFTSFIGEFDATYERNST
jgi:regulator of sirC expression with transglutaminase-like and TPR domain